MNTSRSLRIAQVAPLWTSVPPAAYGGAELMVHWLTEELVRRGHDVTLFASGDSSTAAKLVAVCQRNLIDTMARGEAYVYEPYAFAAVAEALRRAAEFDVIHCHVGAAAIPLSALTDTPIVHTVHAGLAAVDELWVLERYPQVPIAAISRSQVSAVPPHRRDNVRVVHHGCDFAAYEASFRPGGYLAFLGRMGPHKNPVGAIGIAKACGLSIRLAGSPQDSSEQRYFAENVRPLIDGKDVVHLGSINHREKVDLLKGASALLFPIDWEEHFGLVMIEAMACGTPVLATRRGSVPEVIDPGRTGFYADTVDQLETLVPATLSLDRRSVWEHARRRFSHLTMVDQYLDLYHSLVEVPAK
jgi:glycosyltransferase involved in cell wall biosynthesis